MGGLPMAKSVEEVEHRKDCSSDAAVCLCVSEVCIWVCTCRMSSRASKAV